VGSQLPPGRTVRYHYLDALRSALMLLGVFVHAALGSDHVFYRIAWLSGLFRMYAFFLISGFFSSLVVVRYGPRVMLKRRLAVIGVPLVAVAVLINPFALWLEYNLNNPPVSLTTFMTLGWGRVIHAHGMSYNWHLQLWFLISLLFYTVCAPMMFAGASSLARGRAFAWTAARPWRVRAVLVAFVLATTAVTMLVYDEAIEPLVGGTALEFVANSTARFLPFFAVGILLFVGDQALLGHFRRPAPVLFVVAAVLVVGSHKGLPVLGTTLGGIMARALFALAVTANLFWVTSRLVTRERPLVRYGADASYSVYLLHFVVIFAWATVLGVRPNASWPWLLLITALTFAVTLAVHHFLIRRFRFLSMIFNGKFAIGKPRPAPALPVPVVAGETPQVAVVAPTPVAGLAVEGA
jgi:glucan biosynthesis protein C